MTLTADKLRLHVAFLGPQVSRYLPASRLASAPKAELRKALDGLCEAGFLLEVQSARYGASKYSHSHASIRDAAYSLLPNELRMLLHGASIRRSPDLSLCPASPPCAPPPFTSHSPRAVT